MPLGSLQLVSVKDLYGVLIAFTSHSIDSLRDIDARREITALNSQLQVTCASSALINSPLGSVIQSVTDDLIETIRITVEKVRNQTDTTWAHMVDDRLLNSLQDRCVKELAISVPIVVMTLLKCLTGQFKEPLLKQLYPKSYEKPKSRTKNMAKLVKQIKSYISSSDAAKPCSKAATPKLDLSRDLPETDVIEFVGIVIKVGTAAFGPTIGAETGLRYCEATFAIAAEIAEQIRRASMSETRIRRLREKLDRLLSLSHQYDLSNRSSLSEARLKTGNPVESPAGAVITDEVTRKLKYDILESLGCLLSDALSSVPESTLKRALQRPASNAPGSGLNLGSLAEGRKVDDRNLNNLRKKVTEFKDFLRSLDVEKLNSTVQTTSNLSIPVLSEVCKDTPSNQTYPRTACQRKIVTHDHASSHNLLRPSDPQSISDAFQRYRQSKRCSAEAVNNLFSKSDARLVKFRGPCGVSDLDAGGRSSRNDDPTTSVSRETREYSDLSTILNYEGTDPVLHGDGNRGAIQLRMDLGE